MIIQGRTVRQDLRETADVCVIGSGAGGAVAAKELAQAGLSVVVLEAGDNHDPTTFSRHTPEMLLRLFWDGGLRATHDGSVLISQGRGVGGSTVHNLCYSVRTPDPILERWETEFGIQDLSPSNLAPSLDRVEATLGVKQIGEEQVNRLNQIIRRGCQVMGWRGIVQRHNRGPCPDCSADCLLGCPASQSGIGKQSMAVSYIPQALAAEACLYTDCLTEGIVVENGGVVGATARFLSEEMRLQGQVERAKSQSIGADTKTDSPTNSGNKRKREVYRLTVRSKAVVLAAGAINSPQLWLNSRLPDPGRQAGRNLHLHPAIFVGGIFNEEVDAYQGIPQSFYIDHFLDLARNPDSGYLLMPVYGPMAMVAASMPSFGREHRDLMRSNRSIAALLVLLHDRSSGRVMVNRRGAPVVRYRLNRADRASLIEGLIHGAQLLFAAGAKEITLPYTRRTVIKRTTDLEVIRQRGIVENEILIASSHPQGTLRMGSDPQASVVNSYGEAHAVKGLFVADASLFPTSIGVPPTLTIAAMADRIARRLAANWPP
jgi:choline dehydrogenase-like flavoprotein